MAIVYTVQRTYTGETFNARKTWYFSSIHSMDIHRTIRIMLIYMSALKVNKLRLSTGPQINMFFMMYRALGKEPALKNTHAKVASAYVISICDNLDTMGIFGIPVNLLIRSLSGDVSFAKTR